MSKCKKCNIFVQPDSKHDCALINPFECDNCDFKHQEWRVFMEHFKEFHKNLEIPCNTCNFRSKRIDAFIKHQTKDHLKKYKCDTCDMNFGSMFDLKTHSNR